MAPAYSVKDMRAIKKEWGGKGFPMLIGRGYTSNFNPGSPHGCTYVIYQWNVHGFRFHANFYYKVAGAIHYRR